MAENIVDWRDSFIEQQSAATDPYTRGPNGILNYYDKKKRKVPVPSPDRGNEDLMGGGGVNNNPSGDDGGCANVD